MYYRFRKQRKEVAQIMKRLYQQRLTTTSGGNVSIRLKDFIIITSSQTDKGRMKANEVGIITINGKNLTPKLKPTMEMGLHTSVYKQRPDVFSIVHAHPVFATALAASEGLIETDVSGEARAILGIPAFAAYRTMSSQELAEIVTQKAKNSNVIIMQHHGIVALGKSILEAFDRLEVLEATAKTTFIRKVLNITEKIDTEQLKIIDNMFKAC